MCVYIYRFLVILTCVTAFKYHLQQFLLYTNTCLIYIIYLFFAFEKKKFSILQNFFFFVKNIIVNRKNAENRHPDKKT